MFTQHGRLHGEIRWRRSDGDMGFKSVGKIGSSGGGELSDGRRLFGEALEVSLGHLIRRPN